MNLPGLEQALRDGCKVHAFRSGGGLRVIRITTKDGQLKGYGEHPQVEDALSHANEDFLAGGRPYQEVYGGSKPNYLTGSSEPTSPLDDWLLHGHTFDAWYDGVRVFFKLNRTSSESALAYYVRTGQGSDFFEAMDHAFGSREEVECC